MARSRGVFEIRLASRHPAFGGRPTGVTLAVQFGTNKKCQECFRSIVSPAVAA
jgi:hypothetical protein